ANTVAATAGTSAVQNPDSAKYTSHAALFTLVSAAQDHDTPAVEADRRRALANCGRNCGTANATATNGNDSNRALIDVLIARLHLSETLRSNRRKVLTSSSRGEGIGEMIHRCGRD